MTHVLRYESLDRNGIAIVESAAGQLLDEHPRLAVIVADHGTTRVPWTNVIDIYEPEQS